MTTVDQNSIGVGSGLHGLKGKMAGLHDRVRDINAQAARMEAERDAAKKRYIRAYGQQQALRDRKLAAEEQLEKKEDKIKELVRRVNEKVIFLCFISYT